MKKEMTERIAVLILPILGSLLTFIVVLLGIFAI